MAIRLERSFEPPRKVPYLGIEMERRLDQLTLLSFLTSHGLLKGFELPGQLGYLARLIATISDLPKHRLQIGQELVLPSNHLDIMMLNIVAGSYGLPERIPFHDLSKMLFDQPSKVFQIGQQSSLNVSVAGMQLPSMKCHPYLSSGLLDTALRVIQAHS